VQRRGPLLELALVVGALACAIHTLLRAPAWTVDDAFIVARYAENAVRHGRLAFDLEGDRVQGFTSDAAMLIAIAARWLGADPVSAVRVVCEAAFLATVALIPAVARALGAPAPTAGLVAIVHATMAEHTTHATSGLETELFVLVTLAALLFFLREVRSPGRALALAAACAAAILVRPEGVLYAPLLVWTVGSRWREDGWRERAAPILVFAAPVATLAAFHLGTFGELLPNTFHAKAGAFHLLHVQSLAGRAGETFGGQVVLALIVAAVARLLGGPRLPSAPALSSRAGLAAAAMVIGAQAVGYSRSLPIMDYAHRFAFHALAPLLVVALVATSAGVRAIEALDARDRAGARVACAALMALGLLLSVSRGVDRTWVERDRNADYQRTLDTVYRPAARWVLENTTERATLAVYPDAGLVPYLTGRATIDFGGLNDRVLARTRETGVVVRYFFEKDADVALLSSPRPGLLADDGATAIVADPRFAERYELATTFATTWGASLRVYARRPR